MGTHGRRPRLLLGSLFFRESRGYCWRYYDIIDNRRRERLIGKVDHLKASEIANQWAAEEIAARKNLIVITETSETILQDATQRYFLSLKHEWAIRYAYNVAYYFDELIIPFFGAESAVSSINSENAQQFKQHLLAKGLKPATINKVLCSLRKLLIFCAENGELQTVPVIKNLRGQQVEHGRVLTRWERIRLLVAACREGFDYLCFVGFGIYSGLRNSEARRVNWNDIDFENGLIRIRDQKNKSTMPAPLGRMREILERIPVEKRKGRIVCYVDIHTLERRPTDNLRKTWLRIKRIAKIRGNLRYHDLRHTFITECYTKLPPNLAPVMARHSSRDATARYIHLDRIGSMKDAQKLF